jgi:hypothetical protein
VPHVNQNKPTAPPGLTAFLESQHLTRERKVVVELCNVGATMLLQLVLRQLLILVP